MCDRVTTQRSKRYVRRLIQYVGDWWAEITTGVTIQFDRRTAFFASGSYDVDLEGDGEAWDGKIGLKVTW